jgi:hypothetical protein
LIEHLSERASSGSLQSIIATQSPTIIDALDDESLFLLAPTAAVPDGNQLISVGRVQQKLEAMRALTGSTHLLTRCRPIIFIEGQRPPTRPVSDQRLIEIIVPEAKGWVLVASGGRGSAVQAATDLRAAATDALPGVPVFALIDADQMAVASDDYVVEWPVAMIENLLLDPAAIWAVLEPLREGIDVGEGNVEPRLREIAREVRDDEVRLRVPALQRPVSARIQAASADDIPRAVEAARTELNDALDSHSAEQLRRQFEAAQEEVETILRERRELEAFRGKRILSTFYDRHVKSAFPGYRAFVYAVARQAQQRGRTERLVPRPSGVLSGSFRASLSMY